MDHTTIDSEFLKPLVGAWLTKIEAARKHRAPWKETADECMMFYSQSAKAMWDTDYSKKFWSNVDLPKFRITINKAFEMVSIFGPNLFWEVPHRTVESKRPMAIPPEFFGLDPAVIEAANEAGQGDMLQNTGFQNPGMQSSGMQIPGMQPPDVPDPRVAQYQQLMQAQEESERGDKVTGYLMDRWLNYTPREQGGGGLVGHSMRCVIDALVKGRGVSASRPYRMPGGTRNLTGSFRVAPEDVFLDPDFDSVGECRWMAIRHVEVFTEVEKRFGLPPESLRSKATSESMWTNGELSTDDNASANRKAGQTNDLVVWYEIFSKSGSGVMSTTTDSTIKRHLDQTAGQYAYIAISPSVPYPLNMPAERLRRGATDDDVKQGFSWPIPYWMDDRWPIECLDFYVDPDYSWPIAPLAPGLGELKLLNFLMSWFAQRTWRSSRDFWAVGQAHVEHYREYIESGKDQSIIPVPVTAGGSVKDSVEILTQPESRQDLTRLIGFVSDMFDKRVGLTATAYGQNENSTQSRTAEETSSKNRAVQVRPEFMQKQVVDWQSKVASAEAMITRLFVRAEDVAGLLGPAGAMLWDQYIVSQDIELVTRQFNYTVSAASIRRPNRERDIGNFQQVIGQFAPVMTGYAQSTGNYQPFNEMMMEWARLHDADLDALQIPPQETDPEQEAVQQRMQQIEIEKASADIERIKAQAMNFEANAQSTMMQAQLDAQMKPQETAASQAMDQAKMQQKAMADEAKLQMEMAKKTLDIQLAEANARSQLRQREEQHDQELDHRDESHEQQLDHREELAAIEADNRQQQARQQAQQQNSQNADAIGSST